MVEKLLIIRHGETEGSDVKRYKGSIDVPLSREGERSIERTADYLLSSGLSPDALYTSNLIRAVRSAEIISKRINPDLLAPIVIADLRERIFGLWEGMSFEEINELYPEAFGNWANDPLTYSPMGGESTLQVNERAVKALDGIMESHKGRVAAIVAHGGINRIIICRLMGIPLENIFRIEQDYGAVSVIEFSDGFPVLKLLNYRP